MRKSSLAVLPTAAVRVLDDERVVLTRKLVEGLNRYCQLWDGDVTVLIQNDPRPSDNLDEEEFRRSDLPFRLKVANFQDPDLGSELAGHDLVLAAAVGSQIHIAATCRELGIPSVYIAEYSLKTRWQITDASVPNPARRFVRKARDLKVERRLRAAIRVAAGIQCNGTPTFEAYRGINRNPFLFFDTRGDEAALNTEEGLARRTADLVAGGPLRLLFSGRLVEMKGADHLVKVADELRRRGVAFEMRICGGGHLEPLMRRRVEELGLGDRVQLMGVLNYQAELVPLTKTWADLFVCCHRTGDPSCTYLEVMSCGVPIVGYGNEAFSGVVEHSGVGWVTPMNDPRQMAGKIESLGRDREALRSAASRALDFGRGHTFERTFAKRIEHMQSCLAPAPGSP